MRREKNFENIIYTLLSLTLLHSSLGEQYIILGAANVVAAASVVPIAVDSRGCRSSAHRTAVY